jgi:hypothetical protein
VNLGGAVLGQTGPSRARAVLVQGGDAARITLEVEFGLLARAAAIAFDPLTMPSGEMLSELAETSGAGARREDDRFGLRWVTLSGGDPDDLPIAIGVVAESVEQAGCAEQLVCAVFAFEQGVYLVYNFARAAFHFFVPVDRGRDTEQELRLQAAVASDLRLEPDPQRWYPVWGMPL